MKFTIKRSKWLRGKGSGMLLNQDGFQCCIGQVCSQLGIPETAMLGLRTVEALIGKVQLPEKKKLVDALLVPNDRPYRGKEWVSDAYVANDEGADSDELREAFLKALAVANGHEFEFVD